MGIGLNTKGSYKDYPDELKKTVTTLEFEMLKNLDAKHDSKLSLIKNFFQKLTKQQDIFGKI